MTNPQHTALSESSLAERLGNAVAGAVYSPGEDGYRLSAAGFNAATVHRSAAVVVVSRADDVAATVKIAGELSLTIAVQATGHGAAPAPENSILIDTALLDGVTIDRDGRTATVEAGVRWQEVLDAAAPHGLAALAGSSTTVGVVGYTLGGGLGPIARMHGFAADHVLSMDVVTADGRQRRVSADVEPDLFWALLGGGGAFGIVTRMTFRLFPIQTLDAGGVFYDIADAPNVLRRWRDWIGTAPDSVSSSVAIVNFPPLPELPEPLRGRTVVHVRVSHVGDDENGPELLAPMRSITAPILDTVTEMMFPAIASIHADPTGPIPGMERSTLLQELPDPALDALLGIAGPAAGLPIMLVEIRALGGALAAATARNAVAGRDAAFTLFTVGILAPPIADAVPGALESVVEAMAPWSTGGALLNFAGSADGAPAARAAAAWTPEQRRRLVATRLTYDPAGLFAPTARWSSGQITSTPTSTS
ncbi:FAD/FMN-containing dehydrogenase [Rhodococcus sp. OK519]|uniref:FAD-binding oxidoreductase n=1 Tax=Rhodococcus sp. OK519 TaxID=2135729 RepID=UPI000D381612|nr:FAD/FMN-containing dehydrogenase [Rhodococcus sp. OK519]